MYLRKQKYCGKNDFECDMLSFIKCGSFVIESISQLESIFNSIHYERRSKIVQKIQGVISQIKQNNISNI